MHLERIEITTEARTTRVTIALGDRALTFDLPADTPLGDVPSAALACLVYPAMFRGEALSMADDIAVSPLLLDNLDRLQEIYTAWYPDLHRIAITATGRVAGAQGSGVGMLFSGGVDALYSFLCNESQITHLVFCGGLDVPLDERGRYTQALEKYGGFAANRGKAFVPVETNAKRLWHPAGFTRQHGHFFGSMGVLLGYARSIVAGSFSYQDLRAHGSHPMTDPLVSTESTRVEHHGPITRVAKTRRIAADPECLALLRVCNSSDQYNCGTCEKCLRTMTTLQLLGVESPTLPRLENLDPVRGLRIHHSVKVPFWYEIMALAEEVGDRRMARAVHRALLRYERRHALRRMRDLAAGRLQ